MADDPALIRQFLGNAAWLAHRYDAQFDAIQFRNVARDARARVPFLTDEHLGTETNIVALETAALSAAGGPVAPHHFIFHAAYCCSTLMAQAFDLPGVATSLSEPQILNDLMGWHMRGANEAALRPRLRVALNMLARPFEPTELVVIKPSNTVNSLVPLLLDTVPDAQCLMMYAPLRVFLTSIARKGVWGRLWVRKLMAQFLADGFEQFGWSAQDYFAQSDLQVAAIGWLAQFKLFGDVMAKHPARAMLLNSEALVADPVAHVTAVRAHFGLPRDDVAVRATVERVFARDAKDNTPFSTEERTARHQAGAAAYAEEIETVIAWTTAVAEPFKLSLVI